jgi:hypothetical protein
MGTGSNDPFVTSASSASPDGKAVIIGEFPADSGYTPDAATRWQALYTTGYAGGWNWSLSPEHTNDRIGTDVAAATGFSIGKNDLGPRAGSAPTPTPVPPTPTPVPPTPTPVPPTPVPPTPVPIGQPTWTTAASAAPTIVTRGTAVQIKSKVTTNGVAQALVDVEIYDANWNKVYQKTWDNQSFTANTARTFGFSWTPPTTLAPGTYTVMVGSFGTGWSSLNSFNNNATTFTVR